MRNHAPSERDGGVDLDEVADHAEAGRARRLDVAAAVGRRGIRVVGTETQSRIAEEIERG